jgi:hypothetical protein
VFFLIEEDEICIDISVSRLPPQKSQYSPSIPAAFTRLIFKAQNQVRNIYFLFDFIMGGLLSSLLIKFELIKFALSSAY